MKIANLVLLRLVLFYIHMNPNGLNDDDVELVLYVLHNLSCISMMKEW